MNIAICDDLENDRQALIYMIEKYCRDCNLEVKFSTYKNGKELLLGFTSGKFKLMFLDIYMNDENNITGIEVAKQIRIQDKNCIIVFMTTSCDHALDAYEVDAMQYLVKPVSYDKVNHIFDRCKRLFLENMRFIEVASNGSSIKILLNDIYYVEVYNKECLIHTSTQVIKTYTSLTKLYELLNGTPFLRCHRSYIVNMFYIDDILQNDFLLKNGEKVLIRRDKASSIKQAYSDYFFELMRCVDNNV